MKLKMPIGASMYLHRRLRLTIPDTTPQGVTAHLIIEGTCTNHDFKTNEITVTMDRDGNGNQTFVTMGLSKCYQIEIFKSA